MFPWANEVGTVVLLSKGEIQSKKIRVDFSLEDMDMSGFRKGGDQGLCEGADGVAGIFFVYFTD